MFYRLDMFRFTYQHIQVIEEITIFVILLGATVLSCFIIFLMGFGLSCLVKRFRSKQFSYTPTVNFKNAISSVAEDSIYFSEVSPSSDNLSRSGSIVSSRHDSLVSSLSETPSKSWFPATLKHKKMWKQKNESSTSVGLSLKFVSNNGENNQHGKLHISIKNINSLPTKDYPRYTEAYLVIQVIRTQRSLKGRTESKIYENRTKNFRNTRDIEMEEHFLIEAKKNDIKNFYVNITAYDQDIYTKPSELASTTIPLSSKHKEICNRQQGAELTSLLKQVPKNVGNLLVGLSYLPTSQRLSVNIVKAANLPCLKNKGLNLYAQLFLLTGVTGRSLKRKRLEFKTSEVDPFELNGNLSFDITPNQLDNVTLLIILYMKNLEKVPSPERSPDIEKSIQKHISTDHCFGSVAIGKLVKNGKGKKHWRMMIMAPRRVVTVWHSLK